MERQPDRGYEPECDLNMALSDEEERAVQFELREGMGDNPSPLVDPEAVDLTKDRGPAVRMITEVHLPK